jgi:sialic acid synthase SpsE
MLPKGHRLSVEDIVIKSPGGGMSPYFLHKIMGKKLKVSLPEEAMIKQEHLEDKE